MVLVRSSNYFEKKIKKSKLVRILVQESSQSMNVSSRPTFLCVNVLLAKSNKWPMDENVADINQEQSSIAIDNKCINIIDSNRLNTAHLVNMNMLLHVLTIIKSAPGPIQMNSDQRAIN